MKIQEIARRRIISNDGHFVPLVFVDMSIPSALVGMAAMAASKSLNNGNNKKKFSDIPATLAEYSRAKFTGTDVNGLIFSINDINY